MKEVNGDLKEEITQIIESKSGKERLKEYDLRFTKSDNKISVVFSRNSWARFQFTVYGDYFKAVSHLMESNNDFLIAADTINSKDKIKEKVLEYEK